MQVRFVTRRMPVNVRTYQNPVCGLPEVTAEQLENNHVLIGLSEKLVKVNQ